MEILQKAYNQIKDEIKAIFLEIIQEKCEWISKVENYIIRDTNINNIYEVITSIMKTKYLGQVINDQGIPNYVAKNIKFDYIAGVLKKNGSLTKISKIRIFQTYMRSKINQLIPLIVL